MGEHASGYFECRPNEDSDWETDEELGFRNRGLGHQHLFGWDNGKDIPTLSGQPRGWPDPDTMGDDVKGLYEKHQKGPRYTGGWFNITYITGEDVPDINEDHLNAGWVDAVQHLEELSEEYGRANTRLVVYFNI